MKFKVVIIESERGWGQHIDETRFFNSYEKAAAFRDKFNSYNTSKEVPDTYWYAEGPTEVE